MKRLCLLMAIAALTCIPAGARTHNTDSTAERRGFRIENTKPRPIVRLGWGDMMFETANWHNTSTTSNYRYVGHFFGEFQYPILRWLGVGFMGDYSTVRWDSLAEPDRNFTNISLMPTVRFTYFRKGLVEMYSGLGYGININTGTELDYKNRTTVVAPALDLTLYGISVGGERWFGSFEIGGLIAIGNIKTDLYMLGSRIFSVSIGYRL